MREHGRVDADAQPSGRGIEADPRGDEHGRERQRLAAPADVAADEAAQTPRCSASMATTPLTLPAARSSSARGGSARSASASSTNMSALKAAKAAQCSVARRSPAIHAAPSPHSSASTTCITASMTNATSVAESIGDAGAWRCARL